MSLPVKKVLTTREAFTVWTEYNETIGKPAPAKQYVFRYAERYEGLVSYRTAEQSWRIYEDLWLYYLKNGFPDLEIRKPIMELASALRYCHKFGLSSKYTLRELRRALNARKVVIKSKDPKVRDRVTRTQLNKFLYDENEGGGE